MTIGFDLGHDLDLEFSRSNMEFAMSQPKVVWCQDLPDSDRDDFRCLRAVDSSSSLMLTRIAFCLHRML